MYRNTFRIPWQSLEDVVWRVTMYPPVKRYVSNICASLTYSSSRRAKKRTPVCLGSGMGLESTSSLRGSRHPDRDLVRASRITSVYSTIQRAMPFLWPSRKKRSKKESISISLLHTVVVGNLYVLHSLWSFLVNIS